jgi:hypothetical protein
VRIQGKTGISLHRTEVIRKRKVKALVAGGDSPQMCQYILYRPRLRKKRVFVIGSELLFDLLCVSKNEAI